MMPTPDDPRPPHPPMVPPYTRADAHHRRPADRGPGQTDWPGHSGSASRSRSPRPPGTTPSRGTPGPKPANPAPTRQSETGRITDVLWAARQAAAGNPTGTHDIAFVVHRVPPHGPLTRALRATQVLHLHRGDHGETVATIGPRHVQHAGRFHLAGDPATVWFAAATDNNGRTHPVVTADTLDAVIAHATDITSTSGIDVTPTPTATYTSTNPAGPPTRCAPTPTVTTTCGRWPLVCRIFEF